MLVNVSNQAEHAVHPLDVEIHLFTTSRILFVELFSHFGPLKKEFLQLPANKSSKIWKARLAVPAAKCHNLWQKMKPL